MLAPGDVLATKTLALDLVKVSSFSASPDGTVFGVAGHEKGKDGPMDLFSSFYFDAATGKRLGQPLKVAGPGQLSAKGRTVAYMSLEFTRDSDMVVREVAAGKEVVVAQIKNGLDPTAFSADGKLLVTARQSTLGFFRVPEGKAAFPAVKTPEPITALSGTFLGDTRVATLHGGGVVRVWDLATGKEADALDAKTDKEGWNGLHVAEDGIAMTVHNHNTGAQMVWDLRAKKQMTWEQKSEFAVTTPRFRPLPGGTLYFVGHEYSVKLKGGGTGRIDFVALADLATGNLTGRLIAPEDKGIWEHVSVSRDGKRALMLNTDKARVYVWDVPGKKK
ncbi:MAG TPA: WD40 repeat domain-containing protein [Gemmata sp.]